MKSNHTSSSYSFLHAFFWCAYCISWSYVALYLSHLNYSSTVIGLVTGIGAVLSVLIQPVMASLSKRSILFSAKKNAVYLKVLSMICAILLFLPGNLRVLPILLFTILCAVDASLPSMLSTIAMAYVNAGHTLNYGFSRGIGSFAYALASLFFGFFANKHDPSLLIVFYLFFSLVTIVLLFLFPEVKPKEILENAKIHKEKSENVSAKKGNIIKNYPFLKYFLLASVLLFMGHNMYNVFLINIVNRAGGTSSVLGTALCISALCELPAMFGFEKLAKKVKIEHLLFISSVFFLIKALLSVFAVRVPLIYLSAFLQIAAFAIFTPGSVYYINEKMKEDNEVGQALVGAATIGLGGTFGNLLGGILLSAFGLSAMLFSTVILSAFGILFTAKSIHSANR